MPSENSPHRSLRAPVVVVCMVWALVVALVTACNLAPAQGQDTPAAGTALAVGTGVPISTMLPTVTSALPSATPATAAAACDAAADTLYTLTADVDYENKRARVEHHIDYSNADTTALNELVLYVDATRWTDAFILREAFIGDLRITPTLAGQRLTLPLPAPLAPACRLRATLRYTLNIPQVVGGAEGLKGYLSYSPRQINLGYWSPTVAPRRNGAWLVNDAIWVGEQAVLEVADWDVALNVSNAPDTLQAAMPGTVSQPQARVWRSTANNLRDFTISLSDNFTIAQQTTASGIRVELYTLPGGVDGSAALALDVAVKSLEMYQDLFGLYPHARLVVVQGDFPDGMEFSELVFVSTTWFDRYPGDPASYLLLITVHEVAHQWWYAQVGNDAARHPFLDEALATYSEYIFIEEYYPELKEWWWDFRVSRLSPQGAVNGDVYSFASIREYINAVYLRGVLMLHDLREAMGTQAFYEWLRAYALAGKDQIATPTLFWSLLSAEQQTLVAPIRQRYGAG
jgi:hypothetical protein